MISNYKDGKKMKFYLCNKHNMMDLAYLLLLIFFDNIITINIYYKKII